MQIPLAVKKASKASAKTKTQEFRTLGRGHVLEHLDIVQSRLDCSGDAQLSCGDKRDIGDVPSAQPPDDCNCTECGPSLGNEKPFAS